MRGTRRGEARPKRDDPPPSQLTSVPKAPLEGPAASEGFKRSLMALTLITLSFLVSAVRVPNTNLATARSTKVSARAAMSKAHEHFLGPRTRRGSRIFYDLKGTPRRQLNNDGGTLGTLRAAGTLARCLRYALTERAKKSPAPGTRDHKIKKTQVARRPRPRRGARRRGLRRRLAGRAGRERRRRAGLRRRRRRRGDGGAAPISPEDGAAGFVRGRVHAPLAAPARRAAAAAAGEILFRDSDFAVLRDAYTGSVAVASRTEVTNTPPLTLV